MSTLNIFRAADFPATAADTGMEQAAMASVDRIKALEARDTIQYRRRWDAEIEAYIVEPILDNHPHAFPASEDGPGGLTTSRRTA